MLPKVLSVFLLPLYTTVFEQASGYGQYINIYSWIAIFNVFLAYGMETAFFRFYHSNEKKKNVISTALISLLTSSLLFFAAVLLFKGYIAEWTNIRGDFIKFTAYILVLDAMAIIPFALLRANEKPMKYAWIKTLNVAINLGLNLFFLVMLPKVAGNSEGLFKSIYKEGFEIQYIFISNIIASAVTLLIVSPAYFKTKYVFDTILWKKMVRYAFPVLVAGIAFTINEVVDKILLAEMVSESEAGKYGACYKLALFMTLFGTAFRLGVEPFFFSQAKEEKPQLTYAQITNYFVIIGSLILLFVVYHH